MTTRDAASERRRELYRELQRRCPELFHEPEGSEMQLLHDPEQIEMAQEQARAEFLKRGLDPRDAEYGVLHDGLYVVILQDPVRFPDGRLGTYLRVARRERTAVSVGVLARMGDAALLLRHFRHATRTWHWEIPRGYGERGQNSAQNASRELREETGAEAKVLRSLGEIYSNTAINTDTLELFYAEVEGFDPPIGHEGISEVAAVSIEEWEAWIADGRYQDPFGIAAFSRARLRGWL